MVKAWRGIEMKWNGIPHFPQINTLMYVIRSANQSTFLSPFPSLLLSLLQFFPTTSSTFQIILNITTECCSGPKVNNPPSYCNCNYYCDEDDDCKKQYSLVPYWQWGLIRSSEIPHFWSRRRSTSEDTVFTLVCLSLLPLRLLWLIFSSSSSLVHHCTVTDW